MGAGRKERPAHWWRKLVKVLVGRYDADAELAGLREHRLDVVGVRDEILYLVAVCCEERLSLSGEDRVLEGSEDKARERERLCPEFSLLEIGNDRVSLVHRMFERKRGMHLANNV